MLDTLQSDLLKACKQPGCPVCLLEQRAVDDYMQTAFREKKNDLAVRNDIRDSLGLCKEHTRRMLDLRLNHSISAMVSYHDVILTIVQQLQNADLKPKQPRKSMLSRKRLKQSSEFNTVVQALSPRLPCPVCRMTSNFTRNVLDELATSLHEDLVQEGLASSAGLCLPHLRQAFSQILDMDTCQFLLANSIDRLEKIRRDLVEGIRVIENSKGVDDSQTRSETWQKVILAIAGEL
jgi:hypothetical protein